MKTLCCNQSSTIKDIVKMNSQNNGIGNFPESELETEGGMLDIFAPLKKYDLITSGKSTEIRLFTVLERYV